MSGHLPECDATDCGCTPEEECGPNCINLCICDRLRAAEQRVLDELPPNGADALWYLLGQRKGVKAARDAVAAQSRVSHGGPHTYLCISAPATLAAIDALRTEKS